MATRKKQEAAEAANGSTTRAFTVALEQMQGHFKVFGEQLGAVREDVAMLRDEVGVLREQVTTGFAQVDLRFERVEHEIGLLKIAVIEP